MCEMWSWPPLEDLGLLLRVFRRIAIDIGVVLNLVAVHVQQSFVRYGRRVSALPSLMGYPLVAKMSALPNLDQPYVSTAISQKNKINLSFLGSRVWRPFGFDLGRFWRGFGKGSGGQVEHKMASK